LAYITSAISVRLGILIQRDETRGDFRMKEIGLFLFGCIILLMAVLAYGVVYEPPVYAASVPISKGEGPFIGEILTRVPEPGVLLLLGAGLILLVILGIRKRKRTATKGKSSPS
jgi:hypothetical protein